MTEKLFLEGHKKYKGNKVKVTIFFFFFFLGILGLVSKEQILEYENLRASAPMLISAALRGTSVKHVQS